MKSEKKIVIILRGHPGSSKSTFARSIDNARVCSADFFFYNKEGKYQFDASKLHMAHKYCMDTFMNAMKYGDKVVIIDNTNIYKKHYKDYVKIAKENGYEVFQKVMTGNYTNAHGVPTEKVEQMKQQLQVDEDLPHYVG